MLSLAVCPHGGANLACGEVIGDNLRCPFHFWEFNSSGDVARVPWLEESPNKIAAKIWHFQEYYGMIMIWFDAEGRPPAYALPRHPCIDRMRHCSSWDCDRPIYMHIIEYTESKSFTTIPIQLATMSAFNLIIVIARYCRCTAFHSNAWPHVHSLDTSANTRHRGAI